jgi:hypothetical protein
MIHLTLNTGHWRLSPRWEVNDDVLPMVTERLEPGEHRLRWFGESTRLIVPSSDHGWLGTVYDGDAALVAIGLAANDQDADVVWPALESLYLSVTYRSPFAAADWRSPHRPVSTPWVASVIIRPMSGTVAGMIGNFERYLAWAFVEREQSRRH